jgi:hypothetical protein
MKKKADWCNYLGKELVIGCENGIVYKVDTRYENLKISPCWSSNAAEKSAIRCFAWTTYDTRKTQENIVSLKIGVCVPAKEKLNLSNGYSL